MHTRLMSKPCRRATNTAAGTNGEAAAGGSGRAVGGVPGQLCATHRREIGLAPWAGPFRRLPPSPPPADAARRFHFLIGTALLLCDNIPGSTARARTRNWRFHRRPCITGLARSDIQTDWRSRLTKSKMARIFRWMLPTTRPNRRPSTFPARLMWVLTAHSRRVIAVSQCS